MDLIRGLCDEARQTFLTKLKAESTKKYSDFNTTITIDTKFHLPEEW